MGKRPLTAESESPTRGSLLRPRFATDYRPGVFIHPVGADIDEPGSRKQCLCLRASVVERNARDHMIEYDRAQVVERKATNEPVVGAGLQPQAQGTPEQSRQGPGE